MIINTAFVDSGIAPNIVCNLASRVKFDMNPTCNIHLDDDCEDESGHGSMCLSAYLRKAPYSRIHIIKILDQNRLSCSKVLLDALLHLCDTEVNIINLSLSTSAKEYTKELEKVCERLTQQGKIIVASYANDNSESFPACFDCVIGVHGLFFENDNVFWFQKETRDAVANMTPKILSSLHKSYSMMGGTSVATAIFSSIIASKWMEDNNATSEDVLTSLSQYAQRSQWHNDELIVDGTRPVKHAFDKRLSKEQISHLVDIIVNRGITHDVPIEIILSESLYKHYKSHDFCGQLIYHLEKEFNISFDMNKIDYWTFYSIYDLSNAIGDAIDEK